MFKWVSRRARLLMEYSWHEPITRRQAVIAAYEDWRALHGQP